MVDSAPGSRPGQLLGSSAVAGTVVVALVGLLILGFGRNSDGSEISAADLAAAQALPPTVGGVTADAAALPGPLAEPDAAPATREQDSPAAAEPEPAPIRLVYPMSDAEKRRSPVVILNQTGRGGLAADFQSALRKSGWKVPAVGDWVGTVPATTVYYPAGMEAAAKALMVEFSQVGRIRPAFAGIPDDRLTVILAGAFPRG
ncbi:MAG: LytR C-terminal domain-containing protein [Sporichthyaceae bacterium]